MEKWRQHQLPMHSMIMARHGKVVAEVYYAPFDKDTLHRMYSETKSFISLAVGLLISDGTVRLDDPICEYFQDYLPGAVHPWMAEMTIENLLKMETCFDMTTYTKDSLSQNWTRAFFQSEPTHRPGTVFQYDTSATQTLSSLVERLTGKDPLTFLKDRVLREIGVSEKSYLMRRPDGSAMGGSGMMALPMDMMRVALLLMNQGKDPDQYGEADARQLYPAEYLGRALTFQTSTIQNSYTEAGYGYQFWMMPDGGFKLFGMGSQDTFCFTNQDLAVTVTADTQGIPNGSDMIYNDIVTEILETLSDEPLEPDPDGQARLQVWKETCSLPVVSNRTEEHLQGEVNGADYYLYRNPAGFLRMKLVFGKDNTGYLEYENKKGIHRLKFGVGCLIKDEFPEYHWNTVTSGGWCEKDVFYLRAWVIDEGTSAVHLKFAFLPDGGLTVLMRKTEEIVMKEFRGILNGHR